jgi:hypothetical protein
LVDSRTVLVVKQTWLPMMMMMMRKKGPLIRLAREKIVTGILRRTQSRTRETLDDLGSIGGSHHHHAATYQEFRHNIPNRLDSTAEKSQPKEVHYICRQSNRLVGVSPSIDWIFGCLVAPNKDD